MLSKARLVISGTILISVALCAVAFAPEKSWTPLFNGKNLDGWTPKITGYSYGVNALDTFRVEDGVIRVSYDQYDEFGGRFGHLFYRHKLKDYRLRLEYRFVGEQCKGGPGWAWRNSGVMVFGQSPESMRVDQDFPVSVEVQFLGGDGKNERHTANVCTPGTHIKRDGKVITQHCIDSTSKTYHSDQWVRVELEVRGGGITRHMVNGETVFEYEGALLDGGDADGKRLLDRGIAADLTEGTISLQAESHPVEFRNIEMMAL